MMITTDEALLSGHLREAASEWSLLELATYENDSRKKRQGFVKVV